MNGFNILIDLKQLNTQEQIAYCKEIFEPTEEEENFFNAFIPSALQRIFDECAPFLTDLTALSPQEQRTFSLKLFACIFTEVDKQEAPTEQVKDLCNLTLGTLCSSTTKPPLGEEDIPLLFTWIESISAIQEVLPCNFSTSSLTHRIESAAGYIVGHIQKNLSTSIIQINVPNSRHPFYFTIKEDKMLDYLLQAAEKAILEVRICFSDKEETRLASLSERSWVFIPI